MVDVKHLPAELDALTQTHKGMWQEKKSIYWLDMLRKKLEEEMPDGRADRRRNIGRGTGCNVGVRVGGVGCADDKCSRFL